MQDLASVGISIDKVTDELTSDGVRLFEEAFDKLLAAVEKSTKAARPPRSASSRPNFPKTWPNRFPCGQRLARQRQSAPVVAA